MLELGRRRFTQPIVNKAKIAKQCKRKVVLTVKQLLIKTEKESRACRLTPADKGGFKVIEVQPNLC